MITGAGYGDTDVGFVDTALRDDPDVATYDFFGLDCRPESVIGR